MKKSIILLIMMFTLMCSSVTVSARVIFGSNSWRTCRHPGCDVKCGSNYNCPKHTCKEPGCNMVTYKETEYCGVHLQKHQSSSSVRKSYSGKNSSSGKKTYSGKDSYSGKKSSSGKKSYSGKKSNSGTTWNSADYYKRNYSSTWKHRYGDPDDYDDPDEYALDAQGMDFDTYDEAYEYWENW